MTFEWNNCPFLNDFTAINTWSFKCHVVSTRDSYLDLSLLKIKLYLCVFDWLNANSMTCEWIDCTFLNDFTAINTWSFKCHVVSSRDSYLDLSLLIIKLYLCVFDWLNANSMTCEWIDCTFLNDFTAINT